MHLLIFILVGSTVSLVLSVCTTQLLACMKPNFPLNRVGHKAGKGGIFGDYHIKPSPRKIQELEIISGESLAFEERKEAHLLRWTTVTVL